MATEDNNSEEFSGRLARVEALIALLLAKPWGELSDEDLYNVRRFVRYSGHPYEFEDLLERLLKSPKTNFQPKTAASAALSNQAGQIDLLFARVSLLTTQLATLQSELSANTARTTETQQELHNWFSLQSFGIDTSQVPLQRYIPLRVYLSHGTDDEIESVKKAFAEFSRAAGFEITDELPVIRGSWFQKLFAKSRDIVTSPEVSERLAKVEKSLELQAMNKPLADIDLKYAEAIGTLLKSVEDVPDAVMQLGSLVLVKVTTNGSPTVLTRTLSNSEILELEKNPLLSRNPKEFSAWLDGTSLEDGSAPNLLGQLHNRKFTNQHFGEVPRILDAGGKKTFPKRRGGAGEDGNTLL